MFDPHICPFCGYTQTSSAWPMRRHVQVNHLADSWRRDPAASAWLTLQAAIERKLSDPSPQNVAAVTLARHRLEQSFGA